MTMTADTNLAPGHRPALGWRLLYAVPVVGWIARDISRDAENILYAVVILITALVLGVMQWGPAVLTLAALCAVPVMFAFFIYICWPFRPKD